MKDDGPKNSTEDFEKALEDAKHTRYVLRLYIAGNTDKSAQAIEKIRDVCETNLQGRYTLDVIDIHQQPKLARADQIIAVPTLIKSLPLPLRRVIGDFSTYERILVGLNLEPVDDQQEKSQQNRDEEV